VIPSVIYLGSPADVEHFVVVALGLAAAPRLSATSVSGSRAGPARPFGLIGTPGTGRGD
jgi:hypothetical protein